MSKSGPPSSATLHEMAFPPVQSFGAYATKVRRDRFMVSMRAQKRKETFHKVGSARPLSAPDTFRRGGSDLSGRQRPDSSDVAFPTVQRPRRGWERNFC